MNWPDGRDALRRLLKDAIDSLPHSSRTVILLHEIVGLSCEQLAIMLKTSEPAIQAELGRGLEQADEAIRGLLSGPGENADVIAEPAAALPTADSEAGLLERILGDYLATFPEAVSDQATFCGVMEDILRRGHRSATD